MAYVIKQVVASLPEKRTRGTGAPKKDYVDEIALIEAIPDGQAIEIELPEGMTIRTFSAMVRAAGRHMTPAYTVEVTKLKAGTFVTRSLGVTPRAPRGSRKVVNEDGTTTTVLPATGRRSRELQAV